MFAVARRGMARTLRLFCITSHHAQGAGVLSGRVPRGENFVPARCHIPLCVQGHWEIPCLRLLIVFCLLPLFTTCSYLAWLTEKSYLDSGVAL